MGDVDVHAWFQGDELEKCSACGEPSVIRPSAGSRLCLACGNVEARPDAEAIDVSRAVEEHS